MNFSRNFLSVSNLRPEQIAANADALADAAASAAGRVADIAEETAEQITEVGDVLLNQGAEAVSVARKLGKILGGLFDWL